MCEYLICVDFEASCFPSRPQRYKGWYQEILDFGAVLVNLSSGVIQEEFQSYVKPTEFYLTQGCFRKLGICQDTLDDAPIITTVLNEFGQWLRGIREEYDLVMPWHGRDLDENVYFCTWSDMDLGVFLRNECKRKNISYANYLKYWINGQELFRNSFGRNAKLHDAANFMGTPIVGNAHYALDDAKTLAFMMCEVWDIVNNFNVHNCR